MLPPIISTSRLQIVSPSPVPPYLRVIEPSAWENGWNIRADCSGVMPMPVSRMENSSLIISAWRSATATFTCTSPCSVNLTELLTRLVRTWPTRRGSPTSRRGTSGVTSNSSSSPLSNTFWPITVETPDMTSSRSKSAFSSVSLSASILEKSRMSLMMPSSAVPAPWTFCT
ncbi:hypothetical protein D3C83_19710 [compost metagenome]